MSTKERALVCYAHNVGSFTKKNSKGDALYCVSKLLHEWNGKLEKDIECFVYMLTYIVENIEN